MDALSQVFEPHAALVAEMMAQRARDLARPAESEAKVDAGMQVLRLIGSGGRWALPVVAAGGVETLGSWVPLPDRPPAVLGLSLVAGRRCLLVDAGVALAAAPPRAAGQPGHAVTLRAWPLALAVDRADAVLWLPPPPAGASVLADGSLLVEPARLVAIARGGGVP